MTEDTEHIARRIREAAGSVSAPERLHERVAAQAARGAGVRRRAAVAGGALAAGVAAVAVVLVLALGSGGPSMDDAVALALRPPSSGAPAVDPADPGHLQAEVGGVRFPTYPRWKAVGARTDELSGRRAVTVAYRASRGGPVTYTIVDGDPLEVPGGATWRRWGPTRFAVLRDDPAQRVIAWEQGGRTCIVAGTRADVAALLRDAQA